MNNLDFNNVRDTKIDNTVHKKLINAIRTVIVEKETLTKSDKEKVASVLADILCLGKESVYRRLRGEVRFSFDEVALIAKTLSFSVDNIVGSQINEKAIFEINLIDANQINSAYTKTLENDIKIIKNINKTRDSVLKCAFSNLPYLFYLHHQNLSKLRLFKYAYQIKKSQPLPFKDFIIDKEVFNTQKILTSELKKIRHSSVIISHDIFSSIIREINYFYNLNLLDEHDLISLKDELNDLLNELYTYTVSGQYANEADLFLYLSNVNIESSYVLLEGNGISLAHLAIYGISGMNSQNKNIKNIHNEWIESLKRYSTLITFGGEIQRHNFFKEQKNIINSIHP